MHVNTLKVKQGVIVALCHRSHCFLANPFCLVQRKKRVMLLSVQAALFIQSYKVTWGLVLTKHSKIIHVSHLSSTKCCHMVSLLQNRSQAADLGARLIFCPRNYVVKCFDFISQPQWACTMESEEAWKAGKMCQLTRNETDTQQIQKQALSWTNAKWHS